jgi:predicted secreted acid phosphatase
MPSTPPLVYDLFMRRFERLTLALLLITIPASLRAQSPTTYAPPACPSASASPTTRPHTPRPTPDQLAAIAASQTSDPTVLPASEPPNFAITRYRLQDYFDCATQASCYWADLDAQTVRAQAELDRLLTAHHASTPDAARTQKLAIVLDIDETSLSSYCEEFREDFGYIPSLFETWIVSPEASIPIPGTLRLYKHALASGVAVFFITGRPGPGTPNDQTAATAHNLEAAGYRSWTGLTLHGSAYSTHDTATYKSEVRASILDRGYAILLNLGDQWSDLREASDIKAHPSTRAEISVKLPNPFYDLP